MALWELDEFQGPAFLGYIRAVPVNQAFLGSKWLPNLTVDDLSFEYIRGAVNKIVMAHVMGFDSEAPIQGKGGIGEKVQGELPPIKRKVRFSEKEIIRFLQPRAGTADKQAAIDSVYNQTDSLLGSIQARVEWLRMHALSEATVVYDEGGIKFEFDFGLDKELLFDLTTGKNANGTTIDGLAGVDWSLVDSAKPLDDIQTIVDVFRDKTGGVSLAEFPMSKKALGYIKRNAELRTLIRGANSPTQVLTTAEVQALLDTYELPTITTYDVTVTKENEDGSQTDERTMAVNKGFMVPASPIGNTLWGPTAESRKLIGTPLAGQAPGIYAETYDTNEPPAEWVKAAAIAFPTMPNAHQLVQVKMSADA